MIIVLVIVVTMAELLHHERFGHFVGYGLHTDIIAKSDFHFVRLSNISISPVYLEGCRNGGGYAGDGIFYDYDVQKWDASTRQWLIFRGADTWDANLHEHSFPLKCAEREITNLMPLRSEVVAWTYKGWITTSDPIRVVVYSSLTPPTERQRIIYTEMFTNTTKNGN